MHPIFTLDPNEKPLDRIVEGYSYTSIFRRIAFIGDSLSSGEFESRDENGNPGYHDFYEYSWGQYIARKNGLTAYNFSKGGMRCDWYLSSFADEHDLWNPEKACQAYVIALGVNDVLNHGTDVDTYIRQYETIVSRYKGISPDAKFFFVTIPRDVYRNEKMRAQTVQVAEALNALAEKTENAYIIDLFKYAPVFDADIRDRYFLYGHMSPAGYLMLAQLVDSYIDYIVRHNYRDFKQVGFIGSDIKYK